MNKVKLSSKMFSQLKKLNVKSLNIESDLYIVENDYLIKQFIDDDVDFLKEKEQKIELLMNKEIEGTIPVLSKVITDGKFSGYIMPYIKNSVELKEINNNYINKENLINIMIKLSKTLEEMHKNRIIYGDISDSNIIINDKLTPYYADMDGAIIEGIGQSNIPKLLFGNKFIDDMTPTMELDIFLLNVLFVNLLSKQNVSQMSKEELLNVINKLDVTNDLKEYFSLIPNGIYNNYATNLLKNELNNKYTR
ncbi:MAG: hypothetical protein PHW32_02895 [Bacilli bacterium]|nr:hypothetical protein [Bacilli bacterium]MDD4282689.1 hypothetical protein [Bacilli bacterium]MDD4719095.1 hypothetical protein [Bacilli bacterium]